MNFSFKTRKLEFKFKNKPYYNFPSNFTNLHYSYNNSIFKRKLTQTFHTHSSYESNTINKNIYLIIFFSTILSNEKSSKIHNFSWHSLHIQLTHLSIIFFSENCLMFCLFVVLRAIVRPIIACSYSFFIHFHQFFVVLMARIYERNNLFFILLGLLFFFAHY